MVAMRGRILYPYGQSMWSNKARVVYGALVGLLLLVRVNNGEPPTTMRPPTPPDQQPIVIGVSNVQSGASRSLGENLMQGSMAYFDMVNGRGGIYGRKIQVILKDDRYEPDPAVQNTYELITKNKVFFLFNY